jgi:hypothetical protein
MDRGRGWGLAVQEHALATALAATGLVYLLALGHGLGALRTLEADTRRALRKVVVLAAGSLVLLAGAVMLVTPGPGLAAIALGLIILAGEFAWARPCWSASRPAGRLAARIKGPGDGALTPRRRMRAATGASRTGCIPGRIGHPARPRTVGGSFPPPCDPESPRDRAPCNTGRAYSRSTQKSFPRTVQLRRISCGR